MKAISYWAIALLPALIHPAICAGFQRVLRQKRLKVESLLGRGDLLKRYVTTFGSTGTGTGTGRPPATVQESIVVALFDLHYSVRSYAAPILIGFLFAVVASVICFTKAGLDLAMPQEIRGLILKTPPTALAGIAGGYVWGLYDALARYRTQQLEPQSLHQFWFRLLLAAILAPLLLSPVFESYAELAAAFALGAFPAATLVDFVTTQAAKRLNIAAAQVPGEAPTLHKLQGMTREMIELLAEEGVNSVQHLAYADPVELLLDTNLEWIRVLDVMDQACLFVYVGDHLEKLRPIGIRGVIEVIEMSADLDSGDANKEKLAQEMVRLMAEKISQPESGILNLLHRLSADPQVAFIRALWMEALPPQHSFTPSP